MSSDVTIDIIIRPTNDNPIIMLVEHGTDVTHSTLTVDKTVEQNDGNSTTVSTINLMFVLYDIDLGDHVMLMLEHPEHGTLTLSPEQSGIHITQIDCGKSLHERRAIWDVLVNNLWTKIKISDLPIPCDVRRSVISQLGSWTIQQAVYTPKPGFYGVDTILVCSFTISLNTKLVCL